MMTLSQSFTKALGVTARPELELILCCARTHLDDETSDHIIILLQQELNWDYLLQLATNHGVLPLFYQSLNTICPEAIPTSVLFKLRQSFSANTFRNLFLVGELVKLLKFLQANSIPAIPFKGPVLTTLAYGNSSLRQISDLDILVRSQDFIKTRDLLIAKGYQVKVQVTWECHLVNETGVNIDLHREIVPKHLSCSLGINYPWEHLESLSLFGTEVSTLTPEANLLILCLNGTKDCWRSLLRICDLAELIRAYPNLNWQQVMDDAKTMGFKRVIFLGLFLARNLLDAKIPDFIWQQVQSDSVVPQLASQVYEQLFAEPLELATTVETTFFHIKTRERWSDKTQSFFGLMKHSGWLHPTNRDRNVVPLPNLLSFLYCLIRPVRVFLRYKSVFFNK